MSRYRTMLRTIAIAGLPAVLLPVLVLAQVPPQASPRPPRTFPQFVGTWILDEAASTGRLLMTPRVPHTLTIATTPETITVTSRLKLDPRDRISDAPPPDVYRFDGTETIGSSVTYEVRKRFTLVADALALTTTERRFGDPGRFTLFTDALSVAGDVLTLHRQLVSVSPPGVIATMGEPTNNFRHTFVYRRAPDAGR